MKILLSKQAVNALWQLLHADNEEESIVDRVINCRPDAGNDAVEHQRPEYYRPVDVSEIGNDCN